MLEATPVVPARITHAAGTPASSARSIGARTLATLIGEWREAGPAYGALADRIRLLVIDGRIPVDTRLPAERELAEQLELSRTTVTAAYRQLRELGFLQSVRGSGSVTRLSGSPGMLSVPGDRGYLDLSKAAMPALPWLTEASRRAVDELPRHLGDAGYDPVGIPELRAAIADRYTARGLPTQPEQIMVTIGAQHAIALLSRALVGRGDRALIEQPTYPHAYEALRAAGARLVPVSVMSDAAERGLETAGFEQAIRQSNPAMAYLMPDFHNPTGRSLDEGQRERILAAAAKQGTVVVADETTAELNIDRPDTPLPMAAFGDAVLVGSIGKTVWGGLRIGWIRAEKPLIRKLIGLRAPGDLGTPILEQLIATELLPEMPRILELRSAQLRAGRDHLERQLAERFPQWSVPHVHGGLATWVNLGAPVSSQLALAARNHGLLVAAGPRFGIDGAFERFLRLPISYSAEETTRAVDALSLAWGSLLRHPVPDAGYLADVV
ncbi:PLP-dependent aminotransferase family protein [Microterricola viridarii]|uniref:MocR-like transcription factor YczR n=1 Tax=Microterricola viridarii TaxID=412690 RepID=UPI0009E9EDF1|nr:PLP-dependent aminotransferase family protein [Microterricola viridarii]